MREFDYLTNMLKTGGISRRSFVSRALGLGVSAGFIGGALSAHAASSEPSRGGTLRFGMSGGSTTDSMDPATATDSVAISQVHTTYNCLAELTSDRRAVPELAESWEADDSVRRWVFKLRRGVEFHNGKPLTAEDVVYSIQRHLGPDAQSAATGIVEGIENIYADDEHTVIVELQSGNADLPYIMADYHLAITPAGHEDWSNPIGTGPYRLEHYEAGVESRHSKFENYFKSDRAFADSIEYTVINDATARTSALRSGQIHVANRIPKRTVDLLRRLPNLEMLASAGAQHYTLPMRTDQGPLTNNDLRLALKHAIDRQQLVDTVLHGYGRVGNDHPIPEIDQYYNSELPQREYDPERVGHYLRQAGVDRFSVTLHTSDAAFPEAVDTAALYQEAARAAGIDLDIQREPADGYWSDVWMNEPFTMSYWGGRATPDMMFSMAYRCGASWNETFYCNERFDRLLDEARQTLDESIRRDIYWELQEMCRNQAGNLIPMYADYVDGYVAGEVGGQREDYVFEMVGHRPAERLWRL